MKKILCYVLTAVLLITSSSIAFAKPNNGGKQNKQQTTKEQNIRLKEKKMSFKMKGAPVIKYGKYKLPISPITKGMGATVTFDKSTAILTVVKGTTTIVINFKEKSVTVNGVADTTSGIFTARNNKKTTVLIKYIAKALGIRSSVEKDKVIVDVPGLDYPKNVTVATSGSAITVNTLNSSTLFMTASANIVAGQATGGKAELYVGSKLVATDSSIAAQDTTVTFTTSDNTPTNAELQAAVPTGGNVAVKLYNAANNNVTSNKSNPTLIVDYISPTITGVTSVVLNVSGNVIYVNVSGAGSIGDKVDVTKISLYDTTLNKSYRLTNAQIGGSTGIVKSNNSILITLGATDKLGIAGFGSSTVFLNIAAGSLLTDAAGNFSPSFITAQMLPVALIN